MQILESVEHDQKKPWNWGGGSEKLTRLDSCWRNDGPNLIRAPTSGYKASHFGM